MHLHFSGRCGPINYKTPYRSNITFSKNIYKQTQSVWLHLQLPLLGQEVLCRGTKEEAGDQTTDAVFFVQAPQEMQEFLAWQQDLESNNKNPAQARPTVFTWSGVAKEVFVSGSFNNWNTKIPLNKR